jgi:hypothetical protein
MDVAYDPSAWHDLYLMVGGAAAVLTGLIFVGVSLHLRPILSDRWLRGRAESSLLALLVVVILSGALLIPGQDRRILGAEVVAVALVSPLHSLQGVVHLARPDRLRQSAELVIGLLGALLAALAGLSLIVQWGGGLWLLLPGGAIALTSSVWNAWRLLVDVAAEPAG